LNAVSKCIQALNHYSDPDSCEMDPIIGKNFDSYATAKEFFLLTMMTNEERSAKTTQSIILQLETIFEYKMRIEANLNLSDEFIESYQKLLQNILRL